jgi:MarR family transcriptional regulator, 2-MHQ and catechol-resistance regulon repressor
VKKASRLSIPDDHVRFWTTKYPDSLDPQTMRAAFALRSLAKQINDAASEWLAPYGLTSAKYNYLVVLYVEQRPLMFSEIKAGIHTTSASVTGMIKALEEDGLVVRSENPADARSAFVDLTRKGRSLVEKIFPIHHGYIEEAMRGVSKANIETFISTLVTIGNGLEEVKKRGFAR